MLEPAFTVRGVRKEFPGGMVALEDVSLDVRPGELLCLLGPSGCGKSTLLNLLAGFEQPTAGEVRAAGKPVAGPGPDRAMVFQEYALFPWMTVAENVAFGLRVQGAAGVDARVDALLDKLSLRGFGARYPRELSGGMRQRVAIARALAVDSPVLLMDEPFGALDALTRRSMQDELLRLWSELGKTVVFVTHGIEEAVHLADRIAVMTYRPGTIKRILEVPLPRPRDPLAHGVASLASELTALVLEEQRRHEADERSG